MYQYLQQFISAINSLKGKENINLTQVEKKCLECITLVRISNKKKNKTELEYEIFRLNSTEILLMCCPSVKENIIINPDHQLLCIMEHLCTLEESIVLSVLGTLKSCKYLRGILCWLPLETNCILLNVLMRSDTLSPAVFITFENLIYGMLFSAQTDGYSDIFEDTINKIEYFLKRTIVSIDIEDLKMSAFFIHCLISSLIVLLTFLSNRKLKTFTEMAIFYEALPKSDALLLHNKYKSSGISLVQLIFKICNSFTDNISCYVWMEWTNFKTTLFDFHQDLLIEELRQPNPPDNVQMHIKYNAHTILNFLNSNSEDYYMPPINNCKKFKMFLHQIATSPDKSYVKSICLDHLVLSEDIKIYNDHTLEGILIVKNLFVSDKYCPIFQKNIRQCNITAIEIFIINAIEYGLQQDGKLSSEWKSVVLNYTQLLPTKVLVKIMKEQLSNGSVEVLKKEDFSDCLTKLFNQLDSSKNISTDFLHLGLQSGVEVVSRSLSHAFDMPGLEHVLMLALEKLSYVCFSSSSQGFCLAAAALKKHISKLNSAERKYRFVNLTNNLLKMYKTEENPDISINGTTEVSGFLKEVLREVILVNLGCNYQCLSIRCLAALDILEAYMVLFPNLVLKTRLQFASLFVTLSMMYNNFSCSGFTDSRDVRNQIYFILRDMMDRVKKDPQLYAEEVQCMKSIFRNYNLHPRCYFLIYKTILEEEFNPPTLCDQVLFELHTNDEISQDLVKMIGDKYKWSWTLLQIIADCDEQECVKALIGTYHSINEMLPYDKIIQTLSMFHVILNTKCINYGEDSLTPDKLFEKRKSLFVCFSSSAITFITDMLDDFLPMDKADVLCRIGIFWCEHSSKFKFNPELPVLFLSKLVYYLMDMVPETKSNYKLSIAKANNNELEDKFSSVDTVGESSIDVKIRDLIKSLDSVPDSGLKSTVVRKLNSRQEKDKLDN